MKNDVKLIVIKCMGILIALVNQLIFSKVIGIEAYGTYTLFLTWINIFSIIIILGNDKLILKYLSKFFIEKDNVKYHSILNKVSKMVLLNCLIFVAVTNLVPLKFWKNTILPNTVTHNTWLLIITGTVFLSIYTILDNFLISILKIKQSAFFTQFFQKLLFLLFTVVIYFTLRKYINRQYIIVISMILSYLALILTVVFINKKFIFIKEKEIVRLDIRNDNMFLYLGSINYFLLTQIDKIFISKYSTNAILGIYGLSSTLSQLVGFSTILYAKFLPRISYFISNNNYKQLNEEFKDVTLKALMISIPFITYIILFSNLVLLFFGKSYASGAVILIILMVGQIISCYTGPNGSLLVYGSYSKMDFFNSCIAVFVNIAANIFGFKLFGIAGIAIGTCFSLAVVNIIKVIQVKMVYKLFPYSIDMIIVSFISFISFFLIKIFEIKFTNIIFRIGINFIIGMIIYIILLSIIYRKKILTMINKR